MSKDIKSIIFTGVLFIVFCLMAIEANTFADLAKFFPLFVAIIAAFVALVSIVLQIFTLVKNKKDEAATTQETISEEDNAELKGVLKYLFWIVGFIGVIYIIGLIPATILFLFCFLLLESKFGVFSTLLSTALVVGGLFLIANVMNLYWPTGIIFS